MLNENAKKWVAALRSGEFKQGVRQLRGKDDSYCCLGVACELAAREGVIPPAEFIEAKQIYFYDACGYFLPVDVIKWLGLETRDGRFAVRNSDDSYEYPNFLSIKNDNRIPFAEIADIIESEPKGLFRK